VVGASGSQGASILRKFAVLLPPVNKKFKDGVFRNFRDYRVVSRFTTVHAHRVFNDRISWSDDVAQGSWGILYRRVSWKAYIDHKPTPMVSSLDVAPSPPHSPLHRQESTYYTERRKRKRGKRIPERGRGGGRVGADSHVK
jgi:hypothetical protein